MAKSPNKKKPSKAVRPNAKKRSKARTPPTLATMPRDLDDAGTGVLPAFGQDANGPGCAVLDRLFAVVMDRRTADPAISHSARLLSRGLTKVAQKFGEEAVECLIEAVAGNPRGVVAESADVLYHLVVLWVASGVHPEQVWAELHRREGVSGIAEKASRARDLPVAFGPETTKIP